MLRALVARLRVWLQEVDTRIVIKDLGGGYEKYLPEYREKWWMRWKPITFLEGNCLINTIVLSDKLSARDYVLSFYEAKAVIDAFRFNLPPHRQGLKSDRVIKYPPKY